LPEALDWRDKKKQIPDPLAIWKQVRWILYAQVDLGGSDVTLGKKPAIN